MSPCTCGHLAPSHVRFRGRLTWCRGEGARCACVRYRGAGWEVRQTEFLFLVLLVLMLAACFLPADAGALTAVEVETGCGDGGRLLIGLDGAATSPSTGAVSFTSSTGPWLSMSGAASVMVPCTGSVTWWYDGDQTALVAQLIGEDSMYVQALIGLAGLVAGGFVGWALLRGA